MQGIYAATPTGTLLGSTNERDAKVVAETLRKSLAKWEAMDKKDRLMAKTPAKARSGPGALYPAEGIALQVLSRDIARRDGEEKGGHWVGAWHSAEARCTRAAAAVTISPLRV